MNDFIGEKDFTKDGFPRYRSMFKWAMMAVPLLIVVILAGRAIAFTGEAVAVAQEELGPRALLEKYEWFKRTQAALDRKTANIEVFRVQYEAARDMLNTNPNSRDIVNQIGQARAELVGVVASFNQLAGEYNAQHALINWRFADVGMLPRGARDPVRREYRDYQYTF